MSIQGGGIRGIIPCCALVRLEATTGKLARESFDMVAGTSTGALLAACVAAGVPAIDALAAYVDRGSAIFSPEGSWLRKGKLIVDGHMFDNRVLHTVVLDTLGGIAALSMTVNDSPIRVLVTAIDMGGRRWFFVRDNLRNAGTTGKYPLVDCVVASACAPTYHGPWIVPGSLRFFFDGGVGGLADPIYHAAVEAFYYDDFDPAATRIVNLGTGFYIPPSLAAIASPPTNLLENVVWATGSLISSSKTEAEEAVERHWPGITRLLSPQISVDIDEADVSMIPELLNVGRNAAAKIDWKEVLGA